jgi:hypothetical protein
VFEVLGAAHRDVEQMLDRMLALIGARRELRDHGGWLADTLRHPGTSKSRTAIT